MGVRRFGDDSGEKGVVGEKNLQRIRHACVKVARNLA